MSATTATEGRHLAAYYPSSGRNVRTAARAIRPVAFDLEIEGSESARPAQASMSMSYGAFFRRNHRRDQHGYPILGTLAHADFQFRFMEIEAEEPQKLDE